MSGWFLVGAGHQSDGTHVVLAEPDGASGRSYLVKLLTDPGRSMLSVLNARLNAVLALWGFRGPWLFPAW